MKRSQGVALSFVLSIALALPVFLSAQVFRSGTILVRAEVLAEENGRVITGLHQEDFSVIDEGQPQPVTDFAAEPGALRIVLLLDSSGSMQPAAQQLARDGLAALAVLHSGDQVALMTFDRKASLRVPLTADRNAIIQGIWKIASRTMSGSTDIYRALQDAAKYLGSSAQAPNVILTVTDNAARADTQESAALRDIWAVSASVSGLVVGGAPVWDAAVSRSLAGLKLQDIRRVAESTGGTVMAAANVETALRSTLERLRTRYSVYFRQPEGTSPGATRHIKVDLSREARAKHPSATVLSRTAYIAE